MARPGQAHPKMFHTFCEKPVLRISQAQRDSTDCYDQSSAQIVEQWCFDFSVPAEVITVSFTAAQPLCVLRKTYGRHCQHGKMPKKGPCSSAPFFWNDLELEKTYG